MDNLTTKNNKGGLTVSAPRGAVFGVYPGVPSNANYFNGINTDFAIAPTSVSEDGGKSLYYYADLEPGIYHTGASMEGYCAVCKIINYTERKAELGARIDLNLEELSKNGYEEGYITLNTDEFIEAHLTSEKNTWGKEYEPLFNTPRFLRDKNRPGRHQQTTNEELYEFIKKLEASCEYMHVFSLGKTPKYSFDMPLVLFTREKIDGMSLSEAAKAVRENGKPTVQYTAQVHSNEPISTEGALAMMLMLVGEYGERVLPSVDVYIVPRINLDGALEAVRHAPTTGEDMNRDYLFMNNLEIRMVTSAYNLFLPEVAIDAHEKRTSVLQTGEARSTDLEVQVGAGALNHPAKMTETAMDLALTSLRKARELGLRGHFFSLFASAMGGSAGSSYYGVRNSLSFLIETPGGASASFGSEYLERRVMSQYAFVSSAIDYTVKNASEVMKTVHESRKLMAAKGGIYDERDLIVLEHQKHPTGTFPTPIINIPTGEVVDPCREIAYDEHTEALKTRVRPTAYVIPKGTENEEELLRVAKCHAIDFYELPSGAAVSLCGYLKAEEEITLDEERIITFDGGAYVFPNTVPSTILNVIMEPDFNTASGRKMSIYSMRLIDADEHGRLPVYRYCHDLCDGKVLSE